MPDWSLPWEFEPEAYRGQLPGFDDAATDDLVEHYSEVGKALGLPGNRLTHRNQFAALVPNDALALEIGPFGSPVLAGPNVRYCDVLDTEQLRRRAPEHGVDPAHVPPIDYVMKNCSLDDIPVRFDAILSSHAIEHQPDLVAHLQQVERRLAKGGRYFVLAPDKRYCFDRTMAASTIAEVLQAHADRRKLHTLRSVVEHHACKTHNDPHLHWREPQQALVEPLPVDVERVHTALREHAEAGGAYIDVHAWYFTPDSFRQIVGLLNELGLTRLKVERLYRTRRNSVEFWAVLSVDPIDGGPWAAMGAKPETGPGAPVLQIPAAIAAHPRRGLLATVLQGMLRRR
jgi:SAM-dependent methyltransferase